MDHLLCRFQSDKRHVRIAHVACWRARFLLNKGMGMVTFSHHLLLYKLFIIKKVLNTCKDIQNSNELAEIQTEPTPKDPYSAIALPRLRVMKNSHEEDGFTCHRFYQTKHFPGSPSRLFFEWSVRKDHFLVFVINNSKRLIRAMVELTSRGYIANPNRSLPMYNTNPK